MIAKHGSEAFFQTRQMKEIGIQEIEKKHDEFQQACKTILPKVDHKLIEDLLRQQEDLRLHHQCLPSKSLQKKD